MGLKKLALVAYNKHSKWGCICFDGFALFNICRLSLTTDINRVKTLSANTRTEVLDYARTLRNNVSDVVASVFETPSYRPVLVA